MPQFPHSHAKEVTVSTLSPKSQQHLYIEDYNCHQTLRKSVTVLIKLHIFAFLKQTTPDFSNNSRFSDSFAVLKYFMV